MRILVCIRQVPDPQSSFSAGALGISYDEAGLKFVLNDYDRFAMEEAVRLGERFEGTEITVVSVGPERVLASIKKAMELGGQEGLHIDDTDAPANDALSIASLIAAWARDKDFDLILCGFMSEDEQRAQTGPMLAELLGLPCATTVVAEKISEDRAKIVVERELEGGMRERLELPLPALLTVQSGINVPRYGSLSNVLRVKKQEIPSISASELGPVDRCEENVGLYTPERSATCEIISGSSGEIADKLVSIVMKSGVS